MAPAEHAFTLPVGTAIPVLADTHGLLRPEVAECMRNAPLILHAGDVDTRGVLHSLKAIATTIAVRGNMDRGEIASLLPLIEVVEINGRCIYMRHILQELDLDPAAAGFGVVVTGHSHAPSIERKNGVLYLNPGSAGPRRFSLPVAMAFLHVTENGLRPEPVELIV